MPISEIHLSCNLVFKAETWIADTIDTAIAIWFNVQVGYQRTAMKTALLLMIASCMSISCDAEVIVYRNGADGSFLWGARPVVCWQTYQKVMTW